MSPHRLSLFGVGASPMMDRSLRDVLNLDNPADPLEKAWTIPAPWYFDKRIEQLERDSVFAANWQVVGRLDQVKDPDQFFTMDVNGEPLLIAQIGRASC